MTLEAGPRGPAGAPWISLARNIWLKVTPLNSRNDSEKEVFKKTVFKVRHLYKKKRPDGHFAFRGFFVNVFWRCSTAPIEKVSNFQPPQLPAEFTPNSTSF